MDIVSGIVLIVFIICFSSIIGIGIIRSERGSSSPANLITSPPPVQPMWTTTTTYGPRCSSVRVVDDRAIKICLREPNHDGDHQYKVIDLGGPKKDDEKVS